MHSHQRIASGGKWFALEGRHLAATRAGHAGGWNTEIAVFLPAPELDSLLMLRSACLHSARVRLQGKNFADVAADPD